MEWFCAEIGGSWDGQGSTLEAGSFFYSIIDDTGYLDEATIAAFPAGTADIEVRRFNPSSDNLVNNGLMGVLSISGPKEYKNYTSFSGFDKALHITVDSNTGVLSVVGRSENELLLDGRQASYPQLTVEDFVQVINTFNYLLSIVDSNESFKNILVKSSIRPLDA